MTNSVAQVLELARRGALFILNHSAGKDSQAMTLVVRQLVPADQIVVVHAELPGADWPGLREHIEATVDGLPVHYCRARKTFLEMVADRAEKIAAAGTDASPWPSPKYRQCTSDLKRTPIEVLVRRIAKERGARLIVMCEGLRAEESAARAKATTLKRHERLSAAGREAWTWLPIHGLTAAEVFETIARAGQQPHWAYGRGMRRLSCVICIYSSEEDVRRASAIMPDVASAYVATEQRTGKTMRMDRRPLAELVA